MIYTAFDSEFEWIEQKENFTIMIIKYYINKFCIVKIEGFNDSYKACFCGNNMRKYVRVESFFEGKERKRSYESGIETIDRFHF